MAITQSLIEIHLPPAIATIVHGYIKPVLNGLYYCGKVGHGEMSKESRVAFLGVCRGGYYELAVQLIETAQPREYIDCGLNYACKNHHIDIVNLLLECNAHPNDGLTGACRGGHFDLVEKMINYGATNWNDGLVGACRSGNIKLVELMMRYGASHWNSGLWSACYGGHLKIANLMIANGATDFSYGLDGACRRGRGPLIQLMIAMGATLCPNCGDITAHRLIAKN